MALERCQSSNRESEPDESPETELLLQKRRCFFPLLCIGPQNRVGCGLRWSKMVEIEKQRSLWFRGFSAANQLRRWLETMAGPRWKTSIRRFNRSKGGAVAGVLGCGCGGGGVEEQGKFRYDPHSYALNFDEGTERIENFSARYAVVPASVKATMI